MQFFAGDHLAGAFDQDGQDLKGLSRKPQPHPVFTQFSRLGIYFKSAEAADCGNLSCVWHRGLEAKAYHTTRAFLEMRLDLLQNEGLTF